MIFTRNKKKEFWKWFLENANVLEGLIDGKNQNDKLYKELTLEVQKFSKLIYPEITFKNNKYQLILTPNGIKEGVEPTIELHEAAPSIDNWDIIRFRQPTDNLSASIKINGIELSGSDIKIARKFNTDNVDLLVAINGYVAEDQTYITLAFLNLDHILGEFNVITRVGTIDFIGWNELDDNYKIVNLLELRKEIEEKLY